MTKNIRIPGQKVGEKQLERWRLEVSKKLENTDFSLDDVFQALFLTTGTTQGQENENSIRNVEKLIAENKSLRGKLTALEHKVNELEKLIWL